MEVHGSYKRGYKSLIWAINVIVTLLLTPLITTHEPPSTALGVGVGLRVYRALGFAAYGVYGVSGLGFRVHGLMGLGSKGF